MLHFIFWNIWLFSIYNHNNFIATNLWVWLLPCVCRASWGQRSPHWAPNLLPLNVSQGPATRPLVADWPLRWALSCSDWTDCYCGLEAIANTNRIQNLCPARTITYTLVLSIWFLILKCWNSCEYLLFISATHAIFMQNCSVPHFQKVMFTTTYLRILYNIRNLYGDNLTLILSKFKLNNSDKHSKEQRSIYGVYMYG